MTPTQLDQIRARHDACPIGDWQLGTIRNVTAFVNLLDADGQQIAADITPDDAAMIGDAHDDRGKLLADNARLRADLEGTKRLLAAKTKQLSGARSYHNEYVKQHTEKRIEWAQERRELRALTREATAPDVLTAPYRAALAELLNVRWTVRNVNGVECAQAPLIPVGNLLRLRRVLGDLPTAKRAKAVESVASAA